MKKTAVAKRLRRNWPVKLLIFSFLLLGLAFVAGKGLAGIKFVPVVAVICGVHLFGFVRLLHLKASGRVIALITVLMIVVFIFTLYLFVEVITLDAKNRFLGAENQVPELASVLGFIGFWCYLPGLTGYILKSAK